MESAGLEIAGFRTTIPTACSSASARSPSDQVRPSRASTSAKTRSPWPRCCRSRSHRARGPAPAGVRHSEPTRCSRAFPIRTEPPMSDHLLSRARPYPEPAAAAVVRAVPAMLAALASVLGRTRRPRRRCCRSSTGRPPNGARVYFVRAASIPMLDVSVAFDAGARLDPPGVDGLASLTNAHCWPGGRASTRTRSPRGSTSVGASAAAVSATTARSSAAHADQRGRNGGGRRPVRTHDGRADLSRPPCSSASASA
jgi:hypothetical protein